MDTSSIPSVESVLSQERETMEEISNKYEHHCFLCAHCDAAEEVEMSNSFPPDLSDIIGFCHKYSRFITSEDTNFSEDCDGWL